MESVTWAPEVRYPEIEHITALDTHRAEFEVRHDGLTYACRFDAFPGADRLFVPLLSSREKHIPPPVFLPMSASETGGHVLAVCDPTLLLDPGMTFAAFYGTRAQDAVVGLVKVAERV